MSLTIEAIKILTNGADPWARNRSAPLPWQDVDTVNGTPPADAFAAPPHSPLGEHKEHYTPHQAWRLEPVLASLLPWATEVLSDGTIRRLPGPVPWPKGRGRGHHGDAGEYERRLALPAVLEAFRRIAPGEVSVTLRRTQLPDGKSAIDLRAWVLQSEVTPERSATRIANERHGLAVPRAGPRRRRARVPRPRRIDPALQNQRVDPALQNQRRAAAAIERYRNVSTLWSEQQRRRVEAELAAARLAWNVRLKGQRLSVIDVSEPAGVNSQFSPGGSADAWLPADNGPPAQLPTLAEEDAHFLELVFNRRVTFRREVETAIYGQAPRTYEDLVMVEGAGDGTNPMGAAGFGWAQGRKPPLGRRATGRTCAEPDCSEPVVSSRSDAKYCPTHATPAAVSRRYRERARAAARVTVTRDPAEE